jgi:hypothetical protein
MYMVRRTPSFKSGDRRGASARTGDRRTTIFKTGDAPNLKTGDIVPETGIYLVVHASHRLPHEVVILAGERFPRCCRCSESVLFSLLHSAPDLYQQFAYHIYELPEVEEAEKKTA